MEEVSSRVFAFYSEVVVRRGGRVEELTDGLTSLQRVLDGARWYDWRDHVRMLERFQALMGGPAAVDRAAAAAAERRVAEPLRALARTVTDVRALYRAGFWFGTSLYRHVTIDVSSEGPMLRVAMEIPPTYEGSETFFRMWRGTLRATPRMLGLPDATVTADVSDHRGVFHVLVPEGRDVFSRAQRAFRIVRTSAGLLRQLENHEQELRLAYEGLLRSRQDLREIAENTPDALMLLRDGAIVYSNRAAASALEGRRLVDAVGAGDREAVGAWLAEAEAVGAAGRIDFRIGERTFEAVAARSIDFSGVTALLVVARDISERRAAEDRLRRSERDQRGLLEAVPDLIVRITHDGVIDSVSGQGSHPIAALLRARIGRPLRSLGEDLADLDAGFSHRLTSGAASARPEAFVIETRAHLGEQALQLEWRSVAIEGGGIVCVVRDRSIQRRMEAELAVTERLASLGMLAAGVGHEINNPLAYVLMQLRLLEKAIESGRSGSDMAVHVTAALDGVGHIERVVRALKALAQRVPEDPHPVDVNAVVEQVVRLTENRLQPRTRVRRDYERDLFALADEGPLGTIVGNLFVNAIDAIANAERDGEIRIATRSRGDHVEIEVTDDGVGISPDVIDRAFDPLFTTKRESGGLGVGLTLAHRMVTALGGSIAVRRRPEGGTTMTVRLRKADAPRGEVHASGSYDARFAGLSVLVVDDQPNLVLSLRMLLDECSVTGARCGEDALAALARQRFDVVLCDIVMPDIDGLAIYEWLEKHAPEMLPRLVFMTGGATRPQISSFLSKIPNSCLRKPFREEELREVIARTVRGANGTARLGASAADQ